MTKEALLLALEALTDFDYDKRMKAIESIKEALETKDEPVAWMYEFYANRNHFGLDFEPQSSAYNTPLYATPQSRKPLTDKQKSDLSFMAKISQDMSPVEIYLQGIADAESAHGIKE